MPHANASPLVSILPADDEVEDARWLASLITALRSHTEHAGHSEVATALNDALAAAQALAEGGTAH